MPLPHRRGAGSLFWVIRIFFLPSLPDRTATGFLLYPDRDPAASQDRHNFFCISVLQISVRRKMLLFSIANNTPFRGAILSAVKSYAFGRPKHTYRRPKAMLRAGHVIAMLLAADWGGGKREIKAFSDDWTPLRQHGFRPASRHRSFCRRGCPMERATVGYGTKDCGNGKKCTVRASRTSLPAGTGRDVEWIRGSGGRGRRCRLS